MPTLLDGFSNRLAFILNDYVTTPTRLQEFLANPIKSMLAYLFFSKQITSELALNQEKHTIAGNFSVLYLPQIGERTIKQRAKEIRENPMLSALELSPLFFSVTEHAVDGVTMLMDARLVDTKETRSRNLDVLVHELNKKLSELQTKRAGHKQGQLEGIFVANLAAVNLMINFYNKIAIHLVANFDAIDEQSDYYLRLMHFASTFMRDFAYDRELARYSEENKIEIPPEHFLGTGAHKLSSRDRDYKLRVLFNSLTYISLVYSQMRLLKLVQENPELKLTGNHARILAMVLPEFKEGMDIASVTAKVHTNLHIELYAYEQLIRREIAVIVDKNAHNADMLHNLSKEFPPSLQAAKLDYAEPEVEETEEADIGIASNDQAATLALDTTTEALLPVVESLNSPEARLKDYEGLSVCSSEALERPELIMRARSVFTPQLTPQWGLEVGKHKTDFLTPQCGTYFAKSGNKRINVSPPPPSPKFTLVG